MENKKYSITALGDSQTDLRSSYGVMASDMWTASLCNRLNAAGCSTQPIVFGVSGDTTAQILARADASFLYSMPAIGIIYGGVNDPGGSLTSSQTQANIQALCKVLKYRVCGEGAGLGSGVTVASQANLPANGRLGDRYVVMSDTSTTGGRPAGISTSNPTITGNYSASPQQTVWECRNKQAGEGGWGRVATNTTSTFVDGVSKVIVVSTNYLNYATGGDNYNATAGTGTQFTSYATVRTAVSAAATAEGVAYCDLYSFQSKLIYGGTFEGQTITSETTQGSASWHCLPTNQHHNAYGHETVDRAVYYTILNKGWINSLK